MNQVKLGQEWGLGWQSLLGKDIQSVSGDEKNNMFLRMAIELKGVVLLKMLPKIWLFKEVQCNFMCFLFCFYVTWCMWKNSTVPLFHSYLVLLFSVSAWEIELYWLSFAFYWEHLEELTILLSCAILRFIWILIVVFNLFLFLLNSVEFPCIFRNIIWISWSFSELSKYCFMEK